MKTIKSILALALVAVTIVFASCGKDDNEPIGPTQQEIEAKIVGKWKRDKCNGVDILTNDKHIDTYAPDGVLIGSMSKEKDGVWNWANKVKMNYSVEGNILHRKSSMIESWTEVSYIDNATMTELSNDRIFGDTCKLPCLI